MLHRMWGRGMSSMQHGMAVAMAKHILFYKLTSQRPRPSRAKCKQSLNICTFSSHAALQSGKSKQVSWITIAVHVDFRNEDSQAFCRLIAQQTIPKSSIASCWVQKGAPIQNMYMTLTSEGKIPPGRSTFCMFQEMSRTLPSTPKKCSTPRHADIVHGVDSLGQLPFFPPPQEVILYMYLDR